MLISLRDSLHLDIVNMIANTYSSVNDLNQRVVHIEHKMKDAFPAHNSLVDACKDQQREVQKIQVKLADLEDRSSRDNIKVHGISKKKSFLWVA